MLYWIHNEIATSARFCQAGKGGDSRRKNYPWLDRFFELGLKLGYEERNADVRIAQYESGYRVPKNNTLMEMAKILNVNYIHFIGVTPGCAEDIMLTFLWLDEDDRSTIHLFQLVRNSGKCNASDDKSVRYYDNDDWPAHAPVGM